MIDAATTYAVDAPLLPDGTLNYAAWLNRRLAEGVTKENNAAVILLRLAEWRNWTGWSAVQQRRALARELGVPEAALDPVPLVSVEEGLWQSWRDAQARPWTNEEFPLLAEWLRANARTLELLRLAAQRDHYFVPFVSADDPPTLVNAWTPLYSFFSEDLLLVEAMRKAGSGDAAGALADLAVMQKLGRLLQGCERMSTVSCGNGLEHQASTAALKLVKSLRPGEVRDHLAVLRSLEDAPPVGSQRFLDTRVAALDHVMMAMRTADRDAVRAIDWNEVLRRTNAYYDIVDATVTAATYRDQAEAFAAWRREFGELNRRPSVLAERKDVNEQIRLLAVQSGGDPRRLRQVTTQAIADRLITGTSPGPIPPARRAENVAVRRLALLVYSVRLYELENGRLPATLNDLVPNYLQRPPQSPFDGQSFVYRRTVTGWRIHCSGPNMRDEEGGGDDIAWSAP